MAISNISNASTPIEHKQRQTTDTVYSHEEFKKSSNKAILAAELKISLENDNKSMSLLYKTALEAINEELGATQGTNSIQKAYDSNLDISPQATADRIVKGSTSMLAAFRDNNSELSADESLTKFMDIIHKGINKGFEDARDILEGLSVLNGDIATNIDLTYEYVQTGLSTFFDEIKQQQNEDDS
jgi:hypothetical protein